MFSANQAKNTITVAPGIKRPIPITPVKPQAQKAQPQPPPQSKTQVQNTSAKTQPANILQAPKQQNSSSSSTLKNKRVLEQNLQTQGKTSREEQSKSKPTIENYKNNETKDLVNKKKENGSKIKTKESPVLESEPPQLTKKERKKLAKEEKLKQEKQTAKNLNTVERKKSIENTISSANNTNKIKHKIKSEPKPKVEAPPTPPITVQPKAEKKSQKVPYEYCEAMLQKNPFDLLDDDDDSSDLESIADEIEKASYSPPPPPPTPSSSSLSSKEKQQIKTNTKNQSKTKSNKIVRQLSDTSSDVTSKSSGRVSVDVQKLETSVVKGKCTSTKEKEVASVTQTPELSKKQKKKLKQQEKAQKDSTDTLANSMQKMNLNFDTTIEMLKNEEKHNYALQVSCFGFFMRCSICINV